MSRNYDLERAQLTLRQEQCRLEYLRSRYDTLNSDSNRSVIPMATLVDADYAFRLQEFAVQLAQLDVDRFTASSSYAP